MDVSDLHTSNWYYPLNENGVSFVTFLSSGKSFCLLILAFLYDSSSFFMAALRLPYSDSPLT